MEGENEDVVPLLVPNLEEYFTSYEDLEVFTIAFVNTASRQE